MLNSGLEAVAKKINLDETVIILAVFALDSAWSRDYMLEGTLFLKRRWFIKIEGIYGEIGHSESIRSWAGDHRVEFLLNKEGQEFEVARRRMVDRVASRESWSPGTWAATIKDTLSSWCGLTL